MLFSLNLMILLMAVQRFELSPLSSWTTAWHPVRDLAYGGAGVSVAVWSELERASSTVVMKDEAALKAQSLCLVRLSVELIQQSSLANKQQKDFPSIPLSSCQMLINKWSEMHRQKTLYLCAKLVQENNKRRAKVRLFLFFYIFCILLLNGLVHTV